jgi:hypothetical protein
MNRRTAALVSAFVTFVVGIAVASVWIAKRAKHIELVQPAEPVQQQIKVQPATAQQEQEFRLDIPKATWEPIFFEAINERAKAAKLTNLRAPLPEGDLEVRMWGGFGLTPLEGFVLKRSAGQWSATYLAGIYDGLPRSKYQRKLPAPKSGWEGAWQRLVSLGILDLPDADSVGCRVHGFDGFSYVVETNVNKTYRTYLYDNPPYAKCDEAKRVLAISAAISDEFALEEFKPIIE